MIEEMKNLRISNFFIWYQGIYEIQKWIVYYFDFQFQISSMLLKISHKKSFNSATEMMYCDVLAIWLVAVTSLLHKLTAIG